MHLLDTLDESEGALLSFILLLSHSGVEAPSLKDPLAIIKLKFVDKLLNHAEACLELELPDDLL